MGHPGLKINPEQIRLYWKIVNPQNLNHKMQVFKANGKVTLQHDVSDVERLIRYCEENNLKGLTCLSVNPAKRCSTKTDSIISIDGILIDIDVRKERKINSVSTEADKKAALEVARKIIDKLEQVINLRISLLIDSGNGYHIYIPIYIDLSKFFTGKTEDENKTLWDASDHRKRLIYLENIFKEFNNDAVEIDCISKDIVRRVKIPGTWNVKEGITAENYRICTILEAHEEVMTDVFIGGNTKVFNAFEVKEAVEASVTVTDEFTPDDKRKIRRCFLYFINNKTLLRGRLKNALLQELCVKQYTDKEIHAIFKLQQGYKQSTTQTNINGARRKGAFSPYKCDTLKKHFEEGKLPIEELCAKCPIEQSRILKKQIEEEKAEENKVEEICIPENEEDIDEEMLETEIANPEDNSFIGRFKRYHNRLTASPLIYAEFNIFVLLGTAMGYDSVHYLSPKPKHHTMLITLVGPTTTAKKSTSTDVMENLIEDNTIIATQSPSPEGLEDEIGILIKKDKKGKNKDEQGDTEVWIPDKNQSRIIRIEEISRIMQGISNKSYTSGMAELWILFYDAKPFEKLRANKKYLFPKPHVSFISNCTPEALKEAITGESLVLGGSLARMMFVYGDAPYRDYVAYTTDSERERKEMATVIKTFTAFCKKHPFIFSLSKEGLAYFNEINREKLYRKYKKSKIAAFAARGMEYVLKIADCYVASDLLGQIEIWEMFSSGIEPTTKQVLGKIQFLQGLQGSHNIPSKNGKLVPSPNEYINNNNNNTIFPSNKKERDNSNNNERATPPPPLFGEPCSQPCSQQKKKQREIIEETRGETCSMSENSADPDDQSIYVVFGSNYIQRAWNIVEKNIEYLETFIDYLLDEKNMVRILHILEKKSMIMQRSELLKSSHLKLDDFNLAVNGLIERGDVQEFIRNVRKGQGAMVKSRLYCNIKSKKRKCKKCPNEYCEYSTKEAPVEIKNNQEAIIPNSSFVVAGQRELKKIVETPGKIFTPMDVEEYVEKVEGVNGPGLTDELLMDKFPYSLIAGLIDSQQLVPFVDTSGFHKYTWNKKKQEVK